MNKKTILGLLAVLVAVIFVVYKKGTTGEAMKKEYVTVYSSRHYADVDKLLFEEFTKQTGIEVVEVNNKKANPLIERISKERESTDADVLLTVGLGDIYNAKKKGILDEIKDEKVLERIPANLRDVDNNWVALTYRARVLVYNPEKVSKDELSTYEALTDSKWKNRIVTRSSSSAYNQNLIAFMIAKNGYENTLEWAKGLVNNFAQDPNGNDRAQAALVMQNKADIAIMNTYYMGKMLHDEDPIKVEAAHKLKIFFPENAHINISAAGIVKNAKNKENAKKFIDFLTGVKAGEILTSKNYEYPANKEVKVNEVVKSWGEFTPSNITFDEIGAHLEEAIKISGEANWK